MRTTTIEQDLGVFEGLVTPIRWNKNNEPEAFSIYTDEGDDILIKSKRGLSKIKKMIRQKIQITGVVTRSATEKGILEIKNIINIKKAKKHKHEQSEPEEEFNILNPCWQQFSTLYH